MTIFALEAPRFYARGMSVIPLRTHSKVPVPTAWQMYHDEAIPESTWKGWVGNSSTANGNIGLVLGKQSGISVLDVDTDDPKVLNIISDLMPKSPWKRIGAKGFVAAYKFNGTPTFRIIDSSGVTLVEHLSSRTQVVLPPSIHPDTGREYVSNCHLLDVIDDLPTLMPEVEAVLRGALSDAGFQLSTKGHTSTTDYVSAGSRDISMIAVAGLFAREVMLGSATFKEAMSNMQAWNEVRVEKVAGDDLDIDKGVRKIAEFVRKDVHEKNAFLPIGWDDGLSDEDRKGFGLEFSRDNEQWAYSEIVTYLQEQLAEHPAGTDQSLYVIATALKKVANSKGENALTPLERDLILNTIRDTYGKGMTMHSLRSQLKSYSAGPIDGENHTEIAKAVLNDLNRITPVRYHNESFYKWHGSHWVEMDRQEIRSTIAENYGNLPAGRRSSDHKGIMDVLANICPQGLTLTLITGINFANGVLTDKAELIPHNADYGFTYTLPVRYIEGTSHKADLFFTFLESCWGKDDDFELKKLALQEAMCATLFGIASDYQRVILLYGVAASGKSQMLEIVSELVPEEARVSLAPEQWSSEFGPCHLYGKLLNIAGELSAKKPLKEDVFKNLVTGEELTVNQKNKSFLKFRCKAAHWFGSNYPPKSDGNDVSFVRRWLFLTFNHPVAEKDQVPNLGKTIIANEREAIIAWAVEALPRLKAQKGYTLPPSHKAFTSGVAGYNNSIQSFISARVKATPPLASGGELTKAISDQELHLKYSNFCIMGGDARPVGILSFKFGMQKIAAANGWTVTEGELPSGEVVKFYHGLTVAKG